MASRPFLTVDMASKHESTSDWLSLLNLPVETSVQDLYFDCGTDSLPPPNSSDGSIFSNSPCSPYDDALSVDWRSMQWPGAASTQAGEGSSYAISDFEGDASFVSPSMIEIPFFPTTSHDTQEPLASGSSWVPEVEAEPEPEKEEKSSSSRDFYCLVKDCPVKPFRRRADLERHYKHKHAPASQKETWHCDYGRCVRSHDPFYRRDHFRDHLREYHHEDIEKRGKDLDETWLSERNVKADWWRCPRCLDRVFIQDHGFECPNCKSACQPKRKEARSRKGKGKS